MNSNRYIVLITVIFITACIGGLDDKHELSGTYYFASESTDDNIIVSHGYFEGDPFIPCSVVEYRYDEGYITAKQEPKKECFWGKDNNRYGGEQYYYWIIDVKSNKIIGPLSFDEFSKIFKQLTISQDLYLK